MVVDFEVFFLDSFGFFFLADCWLSRAGQKKKREKTHQESVWQSTELHVVVDLVVAVANTLKVGHHG